VFPVVTRGSTAVLAAPGALEYRWHEQFQALGRYTEGNGRTADQLE
jgi:hypothetical protein